MKKLLYKEILCPLLLVFSLFQYGCNSDNNSVKLDSFTLGTSDMLLDVNQVLPVIALPSPDNTTDKIVWESANPEIAQVQSNDVGRVSGIMGLKVGSTTVTASTVDGKIKQSIAVQVIVKVSKISFGPEIRIAPDKIRYDVVFTPENPTYTDLIWTSSNPQVATVEDGIITAISVGSSVITASTAAEINSTSIEVVVSGTPPIFGKDYCIVSGTGRNPKSYCPKEVTTEGAIQNLANTDRDLPESNYKYYPNEKLIVKRGSSFTLNLVQSNDWSMSAVWIDWDGNRLFTNSKEQVAIFGDFFTGPTGSNPGPFSKVINVPTDAYSGIVRMRVVTSDAWQNEFSTFMPCGNVENIAIKDFDIEIVD